MEEFVAASAADDERRVAIATHVEDERDLANISESRSHELVPLSPVIGAAATPEVSGHATTPEPLDEPAARVHRLALGADVLEGDPGSERRVRQVPERLVVDHVRRHLLGAQLVALLPEIDRPLEVGEVLGVAPDRRSRSRASTRPCSWISSSTAEAAYQTCTGHSRADVAGIKRVVGLLSEVVRLVGHPQIEARSLFRFGSSASRRRSDFRSSARSTPCHSSR